MKYISLLFALVMFAGTSAFAQRTITGTITGANDEPLAFATVSVEGTSTGTSADFDGKYSITVPEGGTVLVFSYTGYKASRVELGASNVVDVKMAEDVIGLENVIVLGYSTKKKKDVTGSVSQVSGDQIRDVPGVGVQTALQGRTSGVQVVQNSGTPGSGIDVRVRGSTSISADNQPLYVIDGVPIIAGNLAQNGVGNQGTNTLADLNPNDIESIEVLKDASTAAIYGSRGANGVVLITTKKGKAGRTKIELNSSYGTQEAWKRIDLLDSAQYFQYLEDAFQNRFGIPNPLGKGTGDTDWQDQVFQVGTIQDHNLSISGGDYKTRFFTSLSYFQNQGIVKNSQFDRLNGRLNLDHTATDKFSVGANMSFTNSVNKRVQNDNNIYGAVSTAILLPPDVPLFNEDGSYASNYGLENPLAAVTEYQNTVTTNRFIGNIFANYNITSDLFVRASLGSDVVSYREEVYEPVLLQSARGANGRGFVGAQNVFSWINEYTLNYQKMFGKSSLNIVAGAGYQRETTRSEAVEATGFPAPSITTLNGGANKTTATSGFTMFTIESYFGNINYSYDDRYILTATFRADGSSRFAANNKFGYFPAVSAAWRLSSEGFLADVDVINDLKVRLGYGVTGNQNIGNFSSLELFTTAHYADQPGFAYNQLGNPNLRWETTTQYNFGLDFTILNSRLTGSFDYYIKETNDLLFNRPIPTTSGFTSYLENIGSVENRGFELSLTSVNVQTKDFSWSTSLNLAQNRNEVLELYNSQPIDVGFGSRVEEGAPIGAFFGYVTDGIFQNQEEVDAHATQQGGTRAGDIRFVDLNNDGVINDADRQIIGSAQPDLFGGINNSLSYKGFSLDFFFQFSYGNEILNNNTVFAEGMNSVFNQTTRILDAWTQEGDVTDVPRVVWGDPNNNRRDSDRFVEDGSYIRLKTATLAYNFPKEMLGTSLSRLRLYLAGQNLLTFTNYSWYDPEVNTFDGSNTALGTDFLTYPQARSIVFGINVGF